MTSLALVAALLCLPVPQQLVVQDARQLVVVPRADPKLPTDEELARITVAPELVRLARALDADAFAYRVAARGDRGAQADARRTDGAVAAQGPRR